MTPGDLSGEVKQDLAPKPECIASFEGIPIYIDACVSPRVVRLYGRDGNIMGSMVNVGRIDIGKL